MVQANDKSFIEAIVENANKMPFIDVSLKSTNDNKEEIRAPDLTFLNVSLTSEDNHAFADFVKLMNQYKE